MISTPLVINVLPETVVEKTKLVLVHDTSGLHRVYEVPVWFSFKTIRKEYLIREENEPDLISFIEYLKDEYSHLIRQIEMPVWDVNFNREG